MKPRHFVLLLAGTALGCSDENGGSGQTRDAKNVFDARMRAVEKARDVEQQMEDADELHRQAIEHQGG
jgi:hypothetical protein